MASITFCAVYTGFNSWKCILSTVLGLSLTSERRMGEREKEVEQKYNQGGGETSCGSLHVYNRPKPTDASLLDYVPILPKWSTRPLLGMIVTFSCLHVHHNLYLHYSLLLAKIFLHLSRGKEFQRCFLWDTSTWLKYIIRLVLFTVEGKDITIGKANVKVYEVCCLNLPLGKWNIQTKWSWIVIIWSGGRAGYHSCIRDTRKVSCTLNHNIIFDSSCIYKTFWVSRTSTV